MFICCLPPNLNDASSAAFSELDNDFVGAIRALAGMGRLLLPFVEVDVAVVVVLLADAADEYDKAPGVFGAMFIADDWLFPKHVIK